MAQWGRNGNSCLGDLNADKDFRNFLGYFELTTETSLKYLLDHELDKTEDKNYCEEIEDFLNSPKVIHFKMNISRLLSDIGADKLCRILKNWIGSPPK
ncbi:hypothetical protein GC101_20320 [Paenibacillus sp. LMG 31459]|uniref:CdiI immunity protein domain-containing protein n=1 Tax=Paenibacillus phytohabitans TaxID=2654978 RepID=A0ABX1YK24_9BACL|nr:hypothetical protein [Paenibacillus phytohabitans]NOU81213.1 hypothetical protein [Paenibacillus phytohabitans]